jgi:hypothetical protein
MVLLLLLATLMVVALALALAPGRWRRKPPPRRAASGGSGFLGVCASCAEIVESGSARGCPSCGEPLAVRQRIVDARRERAREPVV